VKQVEVNHHSEMECPEKKKKASLGGEKRARERRAMSRSVEKEKKGLNYL